MSLLGEVVICGSLLSFYDLYIFQLNDGAALLYCDGLNTAAKQLCVQAFHRSGFFKYPAETFRLIFLRTDGVQPHRGKVQGGPSGGGFIHRSLLEQIC